MEIVQRRELWIHTHFVTDCVRLSQAQGRDIEAALLPVLRQRGERHVTSRSGRQAEKRVQSR